MARREPVDGEAVTGDAGWRGEVDDERGAKRRREEVRRCSDAMWGGEEADRAEPMTTRSAEAMRSSRAALDRDAQRDGLVDEVLGDAAAARGEGDDALRQQVQQLVVATERCGPTVAVPVGLAYDYGARTNLTCGKI